MDILPATADVLRQYWRRAIPRTARAIYVMEGERVLAVAGVYREGCQWVMFADLTDDVRRDRRTMIKGLRRVLNMVSQVSAPVVALCDPDVPGADVLLRHMGFERAQGNLYRLYGT